MSSYSLTFAFECKERKSVRKKRLCEMPGAKITTLVPRKVRGQFFFLHFASRSTNQTKKGLLISLLRAIDEDLIFVSIQ